jgi:hypothetical protein
VVKPVEGVLESNTDLVIVADGALGQLPFSILTTENTMYNNEKGILFSQYRKVLWLIRKVSLTIMPSASSVFSLRSLPKGDPNRKAFIGFGDPIFNRNTLDPNGRNQTRTYSCTQKIWAQYRT